MTRKLKGVFFDCWDTLITFHLKNEAWNYQTLMDHATNRDEIDWKKVAENDKTFENFEIFFRNTCDNRNYHKILLYLFVAFWIGAVGSSIASIGLNPQNISWIGLGIVILMTLIIVCYYWFRKL